MNILVLNAGSGSQKCSLFRFDQNLREGVAEPLEPIWKASIAATFPGQSANELLLTIEQGGQKQTKTTLPADVSRSERIEKLVTRLWTDTPGVLEGPSGIDAVGHRVVHGG